MIYSSARFLTGCAHIRDLPMATGSEVAFAGRSNAGKSSTLNKICQQRSLARTSKTPGRTRMLNFFQLNTGAQLVDLPGYGYASGPESERRQWGQLIERYLLQREVLRGLVVVMDVRRSFTEYDQQMLEWCVFRDVPSHILLNKADKLKQNQRIKALRTASQLLDTLGGDVSVQLFSATSGLGLDECRAKLDQWLGVAEKAGNVE